MLDKIFNKFIALLVSAMAAYLAITIFIIFPKVSNFFYETETSNIKNQLEHLNSVILSKELYLKNIEQISSSQSEVEFEKSVVINNLKELIVEMKVLNSGFFYIVEKQNIIINKDKLEQSFYNQTNFYNRLLKASKSAQKITYQIYSVEQFSLVKYNKYFNWYIALNIKDEELYTKARALNSVILNITFGILLLTFIIGYFLIKRVLNPINELSKNALKIKEGNFKIRNKITSNDEIGVLAKQFNFILDKIENNIDNLENEVKSRTEELKERLYFDDITHLKNKYSLLERIKDDSSQTIILIDINSFNDVNEFYGYKVGNEVLLKFSLFLEDLSQKYNSEVFKIYGNVFAIMYSSTEMFQFDEFESFLSLLITNAKKEPIFIDELKIEIFIDITLGIAICQEQPLKKANIALQKAKKRHKTFFVYNSEIDRKQIIKDSIFWRNKIEDAITNDKIVPFNQAIVDQNQKIIKYEMLMRMEDIDENGNMIYLSPFKFLNISVKTKQYLTLSHMMIDKSLDLLDKTDKFISINVSFLDIDDINFINFLDEKLSNFTTESLSRIVFEILESDDITSYKVLEDFIDKYRKKGIQIAIDDFGTGYSNFNHIMEIKPDYLKIDASLIKEIDTNKDSYELVKSIVVFSKVLNMKTIAEFVHSKEVFDVALELGIDEFQGYYFSEPEKDFK